MIFAGFKQALSKISIFFFLRAPILHIDMDFRVFRQTSISHLNCFHSLCKGPFVNLRHFSLVIYSHHLHPLAHSPPPPLACAFVCLHGFYMFYWYRLAFFIYMFFYMFRTGPLFSFTCFFLHVSYRPPFFIYRFFYMFHTGPLFSFTWFLQGFKHSVSRFFVAFGRII